MGCGSLPLGEWLDYPCAPALLFFCPCFFVPLPLSRRSPAPVPLPLSRYVPALLRCCPTVSLPSALGPGPLPLSRCAPYCATIPLCPCPVALQEILPEAGEEGAAPPGPNGVPEALEEQPRP